MGRFFVRLDQTGVRCCLIDEGEAPLRLLDRRGVDLAELGLRRPKPSTEPLSTGGIDEDGRVLAEQFVRRELLVDLQSDLQAEGPIIHGSGIEGAGLILPWRRCGDSGFPQGFFQLGDSSPRLLEFLLQRRDSSGGLFELRPQDVVSSARAIFAEGLRVRRLRFSVRGEQVFHVEIAVELLHGPQAEEEMVRVVRFQGGRGAQRHQDSVLAAAVEIPGGDVLLPVGLSMHLDEHVPDAFVLVLGGHGKSESQTPPMAMYLWNRRPAANGTGGFLSSASQRPGRWAASSISRSDGSRAISSSGFWSSFSSACSMEMIGPPKPARCSSSASRSPAPSCTRDD